MDIVADANLSLLDETFARHGRVSRLPGREIGPGDVREADVLLLRSVTQANEALLADSKVRFVGTATIGTDHLDIPWLEANGIEWAAAPGCNADGTAQFALLMAMEACRRLEGSLQGLSAGIVGRGNVGSRLQELLEVLGVPVVACDPPLQARGVPGLVSLEEALDRPLVSLHVPLSRNGPHPTYRMLDRENLSRLPEGALLINTSRGDVIDGFALLAELESKRISAALDVWPFEPCIDMRLLDLVTVATPHVAGYSVEGKQKGTLMIYRAFCDWAGFEPVRTARDAAAGRNDAPRHDRERVEFLLNSDRRVAEDDRTMRRALAGLGDPAPAFDALRQNYRLRHDLLP